ncbi:alpha/beta hydrolase [Rhizobium mesoamericanum]|uniref:alpha/beta hydrolase n=1 Tax=Rhizobium mesoamericanum TaxID=1079800 RepID=UPI00041D99BB|nr:alpha/beta hydrolase [Rhizobium mesoamericanum]
MIDDPEILAFIAKTEASYPADANVASAADNRRCYDAMCAVFRQPRPKDIHVIDEMVDDVPVRHYAPADAGVGRPAILYCHGGGFVVGSLESHDDVCAEIASSTRMRVTAVDYRLAPEHRYPAQINDVETVWRHLASRTPQLIAVGDSAGANLCAALALRMRRLAGPMPMAQLLIYPGLGGEVTWLSYIENAEAPLLRTSDLASYSAAYSGSEQSSDQEVEEVSPLKAKDFSGLPRTRVFTADVDPLRDDGKVYVERLRAAGVNADWRNHEQLVHGYLRGRIMSRRIRTAFEEICSTLQELAEVCGDTSSSDSYQRA